MVFALETIVENFGGEMAPFAVGLCQHLAHAFWRLQVNLNHPILLHHILMPRGRPRGGAGSVPDLLREKSQSGTLVRHR